MLTERIAAVAHEANREFCRQHGDFSQPVWEDAPEWQRQSAINGVIFHRDHPGADPSDSHNNWMREKQAAGWRYGETKDTDAKTHPCLVPYEELPAHQRAKDHLFRSIVRALLPFAE